MTTKWLDAKVDLIASGRQCEVSPIKEEREEKSRHTKMRFLLLIVALLCLSVHAELRDKRQAFMMAEYDYFYPMMYPSWGYNYNYWGEWWRFSRGSGGGCCAGGFGNMLWGR